MDRQLIYPGAIPLETDHLNSNRNAMVALSKLAAGVFGTAGFINGLAVVPNSPAALNVVIQPGEFYSLLNLDGTAYSSLAADTTHTILKQGILLDSVIPGTPAPATAGQSVVYLIQASVSESDTTPVVLPYYNASNPAQAYSGPANAGTTNNTKRQCVITLQAKVGIAATTGSQTTPAPDTGFTGLYAVTVANGQTTVTAGNITVIATAPYLGNAALLSAANVFTQTPSAPTMAQFDNTTKLASTAFLRKTGFQTSGQTLIGVNSTLTASAVGAVTILTGTTTFAVILPLAGGAPNGSILTFVNTNITAITINRQGADNVVFSGASVVQTFSIQPGDTLILVSDGSSTWTQISGSAGLPYSGLFAASRATNGYQKLPGGVIMQWGTASIAANVDTVIAFPIAFPNGTFNVNATNGYSNGSGTINSPIVVGVTFTLSSFVARGASATTVFFLAMGY